MDAVFFGGAPSWLAPLKSDDIKEDLIISLYTLTFSNSRGMKFNMANILRFFSFNSCSRLNF